uniref:Heme-binding protein soul2 n=1 Tax=Mola mola TaxID=94237 RepID=A0A3Q3WCF7_MOLML
MHFGTIKAVLCFSCLQNFETRRYVATEWISTKVGSVGEASEGAVMAASSKMKSFCGQQTETVCATLNEAWPVLLTRTQDGEVWYSWFVPPGTSLTEVADSSVQKETRPESTVYVRTFGGFPSLHTGQSNAEALSHDLGKSCATYTGAAYDHYFSFRHHNEIWITEEELMLCT